MPIATMYSEELREEDREALGKKTRYELRRTWTRGTERNSRAESNDSNGSMNLG